DASSVPGPWRGIGRVPSLPFSRRTAVGPRRRRWHSNNSSSPPADHANRDNDTGREGQKSDRRDGRTNAEPIRENAGQDSADGVTHVAPKAIDADSRGPPSRIRT